MSSISVATCRTRELQQPVQSWRQAMRKNVILLKLDALPNIFHARFLLGKMLWFLALLVMASVCTLLVSVSIREFLRYSVTTSTRIIDEEPALFPTITVCSMLPFTTPRAIELFSESANLKETTPFMTPYETLLKLERHVKETRGYYFTTAEIRELSDLDSMLLSCSFLGHPCHAAQFEYIFHPTLTNCYRFNSGVNASGHSIPLRSVTRRGLSNGLKLQLYTGVDVTAAGERDKMIGERGFYVLVQNASEYPLSNEPNAYKVTPGLGTNIGVQRLFYNEYNAWPYLYSDCFVRTAEASSSSSGELIDALDEPFLYDQVVSEQRYSYTQDTCLMFCQQWLTSQRCNCTLYSIDLRLADYDYCMSDEERACADDFYLNVFMENDFIKINCLPSCPQECTQHIFQNTLSYYKFPYSKAYVEYLKRQKHVIEFARQHANQTDFNLNLVDNLVEFTVYYDSLSYTLVDEEPKHNIERLLGTIGGHLHLFLGMSLLSFMELAELAFLAIYYFCKFKCRHNDRAIKDTVQQSQATSIDHIETA